MANNTEINRHILIAGLINKVREKEDLSAAAWNELQSWRQEDEANETLFQQLQDGAHLESELRALLQTAYVGAAKELYEKLGIEPGTLVPPATRVRRMTGYRTWLSAAAILLFLCAGIYLWMRPVPRKMGTGERSLAGKTDVAPGKQGAVLTLADGSKLVLDSLGNGLVATQGGSKILLQDGQLAYKKGKASGQKANGQTAYNTMETPKGRQFRLVLPDGSKVWLDAASSLRYPTAFNDRERRVEVTGEAYFEISPAKGRDGQRMPFIVDIDHHAEVEVLGTRFNINAYRDETTVNTTLLEGAVKVVKAGESAVLEPGQQAQMSILQPGQPAAASSIRILQHANINKVMAWKNGVFDFQDATLEEVMRQLQRWYDIDIVYEKGIPKLEFIGRMGRDLSLSAVLSGLELSKVHFRLEEGRRLVVLP